MEGIQSSARSYLLLFSLAFFHRKLSVSRNPIKRLLTTKGRSSSSLFYKILLSMEDLISLEDHIKVFFIKKTFWRSLPSDNLWKILSPSTMHRCWFADLLYTANILKVVILLKVFLYMEDFSLILKGDLSTKEIFEDLVSVQIVLQFLGIPFKKYFCVVLSSMSPFLRFFLESLHTIKNYGIFV